VLVGPLVLFPLLSASALPRDGADADAAGGRSVRLRLSLLFLGAVETSFLVAVAVFWQSVSWAQIVDDVRLTQYQRAAVEQLLLDPDELAGESGVTLERLASTVDASAAAKSGDVELERGELRALAMLLDASDARIEARRALIGGLAIPVLAALLGIAVLQAVTFAVAVRRWMIGPLERIGADGGDRVAVQQHVGDARRLAAAVDDEAVAQQRGRAGHPGLLRACGRRAAAVSTPCVASMCWMCARRRAALSPRRWAMSTVRISSTVRCAR
jgi:hypothetical protein